MCVACPKGAPRGQGSGAVFLARLESLSVPCGRAVSAGCGQAWQASEVVSEVRWSGHWVGDVPDPPATKGLPYGCKAIAPSCARVDAQPSLSFAVLEPVFALGCSSPEGP